MTFYSAEVLVALETLHEQKIIYRDLKPDNVMIDEEGHIKLIDFGFTKTLQESKAFRTTTNCGTVGYTAPEILIGSDVGYSFSVDIWSYGVMIAELMGGSLPFADKEDPMLLQQNIIKGELKIQSTFIDPFARDFLKRILVVEPNMRLDFDGMKTHRFFVERRDHADNFWKTVRNK